MSDKPKQTYDAAARKAQLQERAIEGTKAMTEYKAEGEAERAKTARLKALREAKEAADKKTASDPPPADKEQTIVKRPKWLGDSRATKADKQKKARQQTDQRMKQQDSKVTRDNPAAKMVLSRDDPMAKAHRKTARDKK
jgi:hypothetical protein